jgi:serine/threonine-protein kinase
MPWPASIALRRKVSQPCVELSVEVLALAEGPDELDGNADKRVGRVLNDKWTLERLLGVGGMAAVYGGRHRNGARAAVKILHSELAEHAAVRERFLREGYAANRVEHRGAVRVLDDDVVRGGPDDGAAYLVMELLEGESLEDRIRRSPPLGPEECLTIAGAVLEVLEAAHEHGVVHRDLKPDNIFLARDPDDGTARVKVLDFGLARLTESASTTQLGLAVGTPSYMSPEQAAGRAGEIDARTDIFAVGVTLFRLLTGRRIDEEDNVLVLVMRRATEPVPPVRSIAPSLAEDVAAILDRALAFRREDRYGSAAAMRADVQAAREAAQAKASEANQASEGNQATATNEAELAAVEPRRAPVYAAEPSEPEPAEPRPRRARRSLIAPVTGAFYVVLLVAHLVAPPAPEPSVPPGIGGAEPDGGVAQSVRHGSGSASAAGSHAHGPARLPPAAHADSGVPSKPTGTGATPLAPPRASAQTPARKPH